MPCLEFHISPLFSSSLIVGYKRANRNDAHMIVIGGSASTDLAKELAGVLNCKYIPALTTAFPDGECYTRINEDSLDDDVIIVQNTFPDNKFIELLLIQDAVKNLGAKSITLVIPYFGYARQDRIFKPGEPESAKIMCRHLDMICDRVITVDLHKESTLDNFSHPHKDVKAATAIADYFKSKSVDLVMSPDIGAAGRAKIVGEHMGLPYDHLNKTRLSGTEVRIQPAEADVRGKSVLIVDDMISTGGTIIAATAALKEAGAEKVYVACTHGLFVNNALERFNGSPVDSVLCCNTLNNAVSLISVAGIVADAIKDHEAGKW